MEKISVICHGNIARSQILAANLREYLDRIGGQSIRVFSAGTASLESYPDTSELLAQVEAGLKSHGLDVHLQRTPWSLSVENEVQDSDLVLAADSQRKREVLSRLKNRIDAGKVFTFYEFAGEGEKSFIDTYDHKRGAQDPERFREAFKELKRLACLICQKLI